MTDDSRLCIYVRSRYNLHIFRILLAMAILPYIVLILPDTFVILLISPVYRLFYLPCTGVVFLPDSIGYWVGCNMFGVLSVKLGRWRVAMFAMLVTGTCLFCVSLITMARNYYIKTVNREYSQLNVFICNCGLYFLDVEIAVNLPQTTNC